VKPSLTRAVWNPAPLADGARIAPASAHARRIDTHIGDLARIGEQIRCTRPMTELGRRWMSPGQRGDRRVHEADDGEEQIARPLLLGPSPKLRRGRNPVGARTIRL
jgi:hypothetical protein